MLVALLLPTFSTAEREDEFGLNMVQLKPIFWHRNSFPPPFPIWKSDQEKWVPALRIHSPRKYEVTHYCEVYKHWSTSIGMSSMICAA